MRPPLSAAPYARTYGQGPQGYTPGGYARPPQTQSSAPRAGFAQGGYGQGNSGARAPNGYQGRPQDRGYGGATARGYGYAPRYQPRFAPYRYPHGYGYRAFHRGDGFPRALLISDYILFDYAAFNLPPPPRSSYEWVRYGPDAVLVDTYSGQIVDVDYGVFTAPADGYADTGYPPGYGGPASYPPPGGDSYQAPPYAYGDTPSQPPPYGYGDAPSDPRDGYSPNRE